MHRNCKKIVSKYYPVKIYCWVNLNRTEMYLIEELSNLSVLWYKTFGSSKTVSTEFEFDHPHPTRHFNNIHTQPQ